jgi:hypothetical protein
VRVNLFSAVCFALPPPLSFDESVNLIGQRIDMYYKSGYFSANPEFPGIFVEGGRNSTFSGEYWTIENGEFISEPLWTNVYNIDSREMHYTWLSDNSSLFGVDAGDEVEFFQISEESIKIHIERRSR